MNNSLSIRPAHTTVLIILICLGLACSPPTPPAPEGVSNEQLDLVIGDLGAGWIVETNQDHSFVLVPSNPERQGKIGFLVGPEEANVNLVAAVEAHRQAIESRTDGTYSGAQELTGPMGTAFYSRGHFSAGGTMVEEIRVLGIHPRSSRIVEMVYRYPAGDDAAARVGELIELYGEIE